jgi:hypothetical protein
MTNDVAMTATPASTPIIPPATSLAFDDECGADVSVEVVAEDCDSTVS